jgi:anaerobic glycerol-3-phosphate dehydrogenase
MGNRFHPVAQDAVIGSGGFLSHGHPATADGFTRPPFAHPVIGHQMGDSFPPGSGRHH